MNILRDKIFILRDKIFILRDKITIKRDKITKHNICKYLYFYIFYQITSKLLIFLFINIFYKKYL
jgi:hypothetical protein